MLLARVLGLVHCISLGIGKKIEFEEYYGVEEIGLVYNRWWWWSVGESEQNSDEWSFVCHGSTSSLTHLELANW